MSSPHAPLPGTEPPPLAGNTRSLLEFASRLAFSTPLPDWWEIPAQETLLRLAADVALQLRLQELNGIGLDRAAAAGPPPSPTEQEEIARAMAVALRRDGPDLDTLWLR